MNALTPVLDVPQLLEEYNREGFLVIPNALAPDEVAVLRAGVEKAFSVSNPESRMYNMDRIWRPKMFEHGREFEDLVDHPTIAPLVEQIVGKDCHLIANSALRTGPGEGINVWHADDVIRLPIPREASLDPRIPMPTYILNAHYYLNDVDEELGPTQFVPGSHRAGRVPEKSDNDANGDPTYNGRSAFNAVGKAGTCVLWNDQTWHRGGINRSNGRVRLAIQTPFGRRWIAQRFYPFMNYRMPEEILERANPTRKVRFGRHALGAYG